MKQGTRKILVSFLLILAMLSGMIPGAAMPAMAEEPLIEEALPEQLEAVPAEEPSIEEKIPAAPAEETLIKDAAPTEPAEEILIEGETPAKPTELPDGVVNDPDGLVAERIVTAPALHASDGDEREPGNAELFMNPDDQPIELDVSKLDSANWMAGIRGDRYLNEFNIPYTHDSAMQDYIYHATSFGSLSGGGSFARTQFYQIDEQLERGVRIFDLRLTNYYEKKIVYVYKWRDDGHNLYLCHGKSRYGSGTYWAANKNGDYLTIHQVFWMVRDFLRDHPTETVILGFDIESSDPKDVSKYIAPRLKKILRQVFSEDNPSTGKPYLYTEPGLSDWDDAYTHMPQLKDCRGQVVLMPASKYLKNIGGMDRFIIDDNDILGGSNTCNAQHKVEHIKEDLEKFNVNLPRAGEHLDMLRIIDTNSHAQQADDLIGTYTFWDNMRPLAIANKVHPKVFGEGKILSELGRYYGWVKMDGATERDCRFIYMTNFPTMMSTDTTGTVTLTVDPGDPDNPENAAYYAIYEKQTYVLPRGITIEFPDDIYDARAHDSSQLYRPYLDHWLTTDIEGNQTAVNVGQSLRIEKDLTVTPVYDKNHGKSTKFYVIWDDGGNFDRLRPSELDIVCTYMDIDRQLKQRTLTVEPYYLASGIFWGENDFRGDLRDIRPDWRRVPTGEGYEHGLDGKYTYSFEVRGDPTKDPVVYLTMHHTVIETKYGPVSGTVSWEDRYDYDTRPESVRLQLLYNGAPHGEVFTVTPPAPADEGDSADGVVKDYWTWEIPNLPLNNYDKLIKYSVSPVDPLADYQAEIDGTDIHFVRKTTEVTRYVKVVWDDNDDEARIRPSYVNVVLCAKDEQGNDLDAYGTIITDYYLKKTLTVRAKFNSHDQFELYPEPVKGYDATVKWNENADEYTLTYTLIPGYEPSELGGVFKARSGDTRGNWIDCGINGTWLDTGDSEPSLCYGSGELTWEKFEDGSHVFTVNSQSIKIADDDSTPPWGIEVTGGDGTEEHPYTFRVLRREAVAYWEGVYDEETDYVAYSKHYTTDYELLTDDTDVLEAGEWYVVDDHVQLLGRLIVAPGDPVHLIFRHGKVLFADYGIGVGERATLIIHTEREDDNSGTGISAVSWDYQALGAAIGGTDNADEDCGTIIVHNGVVSARIKGTDQTNSSYPAIGRLFAGSYSGNLIVYGGVVKAHTEGDRVQNAIGGDMTVTVYGGSVLADTDSTDVPAIIGPITTGPGIGVYKGYFDSEEPSAEDEAEKDENGDYVRTSAMTVREGHIHSFVYEEASGRLIATCQSPDCPLDDASTTLFIDPPTLTTYDPNAAEDDLKATLGDWMEFNRITHMHISPDSIRYYKMQDDAYKFITKPSKEAGNYMAQVSLPGMTTDFLEDGTAISEVVSATVYYTIEKAHVELTNTQAVPLTYGTSLNECSVRDYVTVNPDIPGVLTWQDGSIIPPVGTDEEYTLIFTPENQDNYDDATCKVRLDVRPVAPTVTPPEAFSPVYYTEELITEGSAIGGIMLYALGETPPTNDADWQYTVPTITEPGTYTLWYKVFGDSNYTDTVPQCITITVAGGFTLPAGLVTIGEEAFAGIPVSRVEFTENVKTIGPRAFADCKNLREFVVPATVESIDDTALAGCTGVTIYGDIGSEAERFASDNGFMFASWIDW